MSLDADLKAALITLRYDQIVIFTNNKILCFICLLIPAKVVPVHKDTHQEIFFLILIKMSFTVETIQQMEVTITC